MPGIIQSVSSTSIRSVVSSSQALDPIRGDEALVAQLDDHRLEDESTRGVVVGDQDAHLTSPGSDQEFA